MVFREVKKKKNGIKNKKWKVDEMLCFVVSLTGGY